MDFQVKSRSGEMDRIKVSVVGFFMPTSKRSSREATTAPDDRTRKPLTAPAQRPYPIDVALRKVLPYCPWEVGPHPRLRLDAFRWKDGRWAIMLDAAAVGGRARGARRCTRGLAVTLVAPGHALGQRLLRIELDDALWRQVHDLEGAGLISRDLEPARGGLGRWDEDTHVFAADFHAAGEINHFESRLGFRFPSLEGVAHFGPAELFA